MPAIIGLIAALAMEARPLLRLSASWRSFPFPGFRAYSLRVSHVDCILVESGMGMDKAAAATRALLSVATPRFLVSFGIAGSAASDLRIGDVILGTSVALFEAGSLGNGADLTSLSRPAYEAVRCAVEPRGVRFRTGTAITTRGPQPSARQLEEWPFPFLEMETAGIDRIAREHGISLISIRSISDSPEEPFPIPVEDLVDSEGAFRLASLIANCLRHPSMLSRLIRSGRNARTAAENAAHAVAALLQDPI